MAIPFFMTRINITDNIINIGTKIKSVVLKSFVNTKLKFRFSGFSLAKNGISKIIAGKLFTISETRKKSDIKRREKIMTNSQGVKSIEIKIINREWKDNRY